MGLRKKPWLWCPSQDLLMPQKKPAGPFCPGPHEGNPEPGSLPLPTGKNL